MQQLLSALPHFCLGAARHAPAWAEQQAPWCPSPRPQLLQAPQAGVRPHSALHSPNTLSRVLGPCRNPSFLSSRLQKVVPLVRPGPGSTRVEVQDLTHDTVAGSHPGLWLTSFAQEPPSSVRAPRTTPRDAQPGPDGSLLRPRDEVVLGALGPCPAVPGGLCLECGACTPAPAPGWVSLQQFLLTTQLAGECVQISDSQQVHTIVQPPLPSIWELFCHPRKNTRGRRARGGRRDRATG